MVDNGIQKALGRLEGKMDLLLDRSDSQEERIQKLESCKNWARGAVAMAVISWAFILKLLWR